MKFEIGNIVKCNRNRENFDVIGEKGKIIFINSRAGHEYLIEFFSEIENGHEGNSHEIIGKDGHCWWVDEIDISLSEPEKTKLYGIVQFVNNVNSGVYK